MFKKLKRWILPTACKALLLLLGPSTAVAETPPPEEENELRLESSFLESANEERSLRTQRAMGVLGGWAVLNIGTGTAGLFLTEGEARGFHEMNLGWNVVNLAIAALGFRNARREDPARFDAMETLQEAYLMERILLVNMGLNVAYMATGLYLRERGAGRDDARQVGWGNSLLVQGGFLLGFDTTLFLLQRRRTNEVVKELRPRLLVNQDIRGVGFEGRF